MNAPGPNTDLTAALEGLVSGQAGAVNQLLPQVYERLHALARHQLERESPGHTLQPTALVHEAYLRLVDQRQTHWQSQAHFLAIAAQAMRRILIDHARGKLRDKRGGGRPRISLTDAELATPVRELDVLALDEALARLAGDDAVAARIVEMRFFAGMDIGSIAQVLGVTDRTVRRHWVYAKAWITRELLRQDDGRKTAAEVEP